MKSFSLKNVEIHARVEASRRRQVTTSFAQLNTAELQRPKQRILGHKLKTIFDQIRFIKKYFVYVIIFENKMNILK